jgi:Uma2 family endonuclease
MSAMAHEPLSQEETLLEGFLALETPQGFRAELIEGEIVVTPPPSGRHERWLSRIALQVARKSEVVMDASGNRGLEVPRGGLCPKNHVIPEVVFAPLELDLFDDDESWMPCDGVAMVVEVTSGQPERDRTAKRHCYARGGIPLYLLIDRENETVTLFAEPEGDDYQADCRRPFGKPIELPAPFSFTLETGDFA